MLILKLQYQSLDPVLEQLYVEVDLKADPPAAQTMIGENLRLMNRQ